MFTEGKGNMLIKVLSLFTVANARGEEIDQGTQLRYLGEIVWYPTAALCDYIKWEAIDTHSARATMSYDGLSTSGVFEFNDLGEVTSFSADRYMAVDGKYVLEKWLVTMKDYREFEGIRYQPREKSSGD
ncbi:hypothetical protein N752_18765 [Desulforamulus aquiferis]|nr:hypothetical protein N752_18765 [Desulforamulus aquiferis]